MSSRSVVLYLHVHQPWRIRDYSLFETARSHEYVNGSDDNDRNNQRVFQKVAQKSYRPMNKLLLELLEQHSDFKLSLSITGTFVEQATLYAPDVLDDFRRLIDTGRVEIVAETYYHSLAFFYSRKEFERQVTLHADMVKKEFGVTPTAFRNTELAYNNALAQWADERGYKAIISEGWDPILDGRSASHVYAPPSHQAIRLLTKHYRLSDDIAFRFGDAARSPSPLTAPQFVEWLNETTRQGPLINLFMDYETFGEHQWADTGIFEFFRAFVGDWLGQLDADFETISGAAQRYQPVEELSMPHTVTWADSERDLSAWTGNELQQEALRLIYDLEHDVLRSNDATLIRDWRRLQTSDHAYYMCTKWFKDGDVHAYFSPYDSPYDAFLYTLNVIRDIRYRLQAYHSSAHGSL